MELKLHSSSVPGFHQLEYFEQDYVRKKDYIPKTTISEIHSNTFNSDDDFWDKLHIL